MTQRLRNSNLEELNSQVYCHWKVSHHLKPTYNHGSWAMNHESSFGNLVASLWHDHFQIFPEMEEMFS